jgi:hypothetical protein
MKSRTGIYYKPQINYAKLYGWLFVISLVVNLILLDVYFIQKDIISSKDTTIQGLCPKSDTIGNCYTPKHKKHEGN